MLVNYILYNIQKCLYKYTNVNNEGGLDVIPQVLLISKQQIRS